MEEAGALAETLDDPRRRSMVAAARSHYLWVMSRHVDAAAAADQAVALARAAGDGALERDATLYMGIVHGAMGNYRRAVEVLRSTLTAYEAAELQVVDARSDDQPSHRPHLSRAIPGRTG